MVWEYALVVLLLVLSFLVILLVPMVMNMNRAIKKFSATLETLNKDLPDIMYDISEITYRASKATEAMNNTIDDIVEIEKNISKHVKQPLVDVAASFGGIIQAFQAFITYFIRKK